MSARAKSHPHWYQLPRWRRMDGLEWSNTDQHTIQKVPLWDFMDGMKLSLMSQSNAASLKATTMRSSTRSCCVFFLVKVLEVPRPQWRRDPCHRAFFCVQVPEVPKAMTTKNLAPHCHSFLFQWCKSFKRTTTRSLAPHHHVFFLLWCCMSQGHGDEEPNSLSSCFFVAILQVIQAHHNGKLTSSSSCFFCSNIPSP